MTDNADANGSGAEAAPRTDAAIKGGSPEQDSTERRVGVGPHIQPWPDDPRLDPELLAEGDTRNVIDRFRYWRHDAIVAELAENSFEYHVAVENFEHDFNIGTVVRNANAFGAAGVHIVGRRRWNRRGAMVTDRYLEVRHHRDVVDFVYWAAQEDLVIVGIDNIEGSVPIEVTPMPANSVLLFGQEGPGLSPASREAATMICSIEMYGSTRSVNAGVASGIAMYQWLLTNGPEASVDGSLGFC